MAELAVGSSGHRAGPLHRLGRRRALRRFYTEVLGGRLAFSGPGGLTYVALANTWIIINVGGGPTDDKPTVTLETPRDPDRVSSFLNIRVRDIHAVYAEWSARGAEFLTPPKQHQYEIRCYIRDPDGYLIEVGQTTDPTATGRRPAGRRTGPPATSHDWRALWRFRRPADGNAIGLPRLLLQRRCLAVAGLVAEGAQHLVAALVEQPAQRGRAARGPTPGRRRWPRSSPRRRRRPSSRPPRSPAPWPTTTPARPRRPRRSTPAGTARPARAGRGRRTRPAWRGTSRSSASRRSASPRFPACP